MKIKAIPVKSKTLCDRCYFNWRDNCVGRQKDKSCKLCAAYNFHKECCNCELIRLGEPCRHFINKERGEFLIKKIHEIFSR